MRSRHLKLQGSEKYVLIALDAGAGLGFTGVVAP